MVCSSGFILAFVRNNEPMFWTISKQCLKNKKFRQELNKTYIELNSDLWNIPISHVMQKNLRTETTYCILSGIYETLDLATEVPELIPDDYFTDENYKGHISHKFSDKNLSHDVYGIKNSSFPYYVVTEHSPGVFQHLRQLDGISIQIAKMSLDPANNKSTLYTIHNAHGGSGSLFIFTEDNRFVIKTIRKTERKTLVKRFLKDYHKHICNNKDSLLCRIYGIYTIRVPGLAPLELLLSENLKKSDVIRFYDLKGSTYKRFANETSEDFIGPYKDSDFLNENRGIELIPAYRNSLLRRVYKDADLLRKHSIMDYSVLVQVHNTEYESSFYSKESHKWYSFAIIDYLNRYTFKKKVEYYLKKLKFGRKINTISVRDPFKYFRRFFNFMSEKILTQNQNVHHKLY